MANESTNYFELYKLHISKATDQAAVRLKLLVLTATVSLGLVTVWGNGLFLQKSVDQIMILFPILGAVFNAIVFSFDRRLYPQERQHVSAAKALESRLKIDVHLGVASIMEECLPKLYPPKIQIGMALLSLTFMGAAILTYFMTRPL